MSLNNPESGIIKELVEQLKVAQFTIKDMGLRTTLHQLGHSDLQVISQEPLRLRVIALREGTWNGVQYPAEEIKKSVGQIKGIPVRVEHAKDPNFKGRIVGTVTNALWDEFFNAAVAELEITDKTAAQMVLDKVFPAVSISTFLDFDEKGVGSNFKHLELSLVRRPACTECYIISHLSENCGDIDPATCPCKQNPPISVRTPKPPTEGINLPIQPSPSMPAQNQDSDMIPGKVRGGGPVGLSCPHCGHALARPLPDYTTDQPTAEYAERAGESGDKPSAASPVTAPSKKGPGGFWGDIGGQKLGLALLSHDSGSLYVIAYKSILAKFMAKPDKPIPQHSKEDPITDDQIEMVGPQKDEIPKREFGGSK
jgi:hypothetical protein